MDVSVDSEIMEYSSESDKLDGNWSAIDAGTSNINSKLDNTENHEKNKGDIQNLSDISVSSVDTYTPKSQQNSKYLLPIEITNWEPLFIDDKLVISGNVAGLVQSDRVCKQRLSSLIFKDDDGITCCILGPMKAQSEVPEVIRSEFKYIYRIEKDGEKILKDGIPENWLRLCSIWKFYLESVNKNTFDWSLHFKIFSFQPLNQFNNNGRLMEKTTNGSKTKIMDNGPRTKIKKKYEKYKSMLEQEILRDTMIVESESESDMQIQKKLKRKKVICHQEINGLPRTNNKNTTAILTNLEIDTPTSSTTIVEPEQTSLNKRTSCYIYNQIATESDEQSGRNSVQCQTDLTLNDFEENQMDDSERNDKNQSSNVTILSPTKQTFKLKTTKAVSENVCAINDQLNKKSKNESNKKIIASNTILKDLTNKEEFNNLPTLDKNISKPVRNALTQFFSKSVNSDTLRFSLNQSWKPLSNLDTNDDSSSLEFYENIVANSTAIAAKTPLKLENCKRIHDICSKTLERLEKQSPTTVVTNTNVVDTFDVIDIDIFSRSKPVSKDQTENVSSEPEINVPPDPKQLKTIKNNLEKTTSSVSSSSSSTLTENSYHLRSPKRYIATSQTKGVKRKKEVELNDEENAKKIALNMENKAKPVSLTPVSSKPECTKPESTKPESTNQKSSKQKSSKQKSSKLELSNPESSIMVLSSPESSNLESVKPTRFSLRNRKKLNYRELVFNRIKLPENAIVDSKTRKSMFHVIKTSKAQLKKDAKLYRKCYVILKRENLEQKRKNMGDAISTSNFKVTNINIEKENSTPGNNTIIQNNIQNKTPNNIQNKTPNNIQNKTPNNIQNKSQVDHVFKTPLTTVVQKKKKLLNSNDLSKMHKTLHIPNFMPKIKDQRKLSLPANPMEMWKMINSKAKVEKPQPPSPFSLLSDTSSDASDKKRRKLFSPDNWMQSDGCLKNLSQNQYQSSQFSLRFDDTDPNMDSELSDSSMIASF